MADDDVVGALAILAAHGRALLGAAWVGFLLADPGGDERLAASAGDAEVGARVDAPLRDRDTRYGTLSVRYTGVPRADHTVLFEAVAAVAVVVLANDARRRRAERLVTQLQRALHSRIAIEQAKGIVAERHRLDVDGAFVRLRRYARDHDLPLAEVASRVVAGTLRL